MSRTIVVLDGDGVGPEVSRAACHVLRTMSPKFEILTPPVGEMAAKNLGSVLPEETKKLAAKADAVLFGAAGDTSGPVIAYLRWGLDNYVNIRPMKYYAGAYTPLKDAEGIDFVILRENSEGFYPWGREGDISQLAEKWPEWRDRCLGKSFSDYGMGKFTIGIFTEAATKRMAKFACEFTEKRQQMGHPGTLTCVTKTNVLPETTGLFRKAMEEEIKEHPKLSYEHFFIDDMCRRVLRYPKDIDVLATTNMFGDIISDEAAEIVGGLGVAPSACVGGRTPYFEPVHGSAPKYAGKNVINPTAMILSVKMMFDYFTMAEEAQALDRAVAEVYREGKYLTRDQGGGATTTEMTEAFIKKL